jgi:hypothetical protein
VGSGFFREIQGAHTDAELLRENERLRKENRILRPGAVRQMRTSLCFPRAGLILGREQVAPLCESGGAGLFEVIAVLEVTLRRKVVVDRGMDGCELL